MTIRKYVLLSIFFLFIFFPGNRTIAAGETVTEPSTTIDLTDSERAWLAAHPKIRIGIMDAWPPINFVDDTGTPQGLGVDYIGALNRRLGGILTIVPGPFKENYDRVKNKELDALMDITPKKKREAFFNFTKPYLIIPHVIVGRKDGPYFNSEKDLTGKTVALERGYYNVKFFKKNYPEVKIKEYGSTSEALDAVSRGEADAYVGNRAVVNYLIVKELLGNLQVQGRMAKPPVVLTIGVRKDWTLLAGLLQKALDAINENERSAILRNWVAVAYEKGVNYSLIWKVALGAGLVLALFIFWNLSLARQVTRRKRAENAARDSEQRLSQIIDFLPDATFVIDLEGKVQAWNRSIEKMTGIKPEAILGKGNYEYALPFYGKRRPILANLALQWDDHVAEKYNTITKIGDDLFGEHFYPHMGEKGKGLHTWTTVSLIRNADGDVTGAIESVRDVSDRKEIEALHERYEFIVNTIKDPMSFVNADYVYEAVNDAWCNSLQLNKAESFGKTVAAIWGTELFDNEIRPNLERCFAGECVSNELWLDLPSKGRRFYRTTMYPFFNKQQEITHAALVTRDVTERKEAEETQKKRIDDLAQARRAMLSMMEDLQKEVSIRKKTEEELHNNIQMLERFRKMAVGREHQMIKLKEEINELLSETDRPHKYKIVG